MLSSFLQSSKPLILVFGETNLDNINEAFDKLFSYI